MIDSICDLLPDPHVLLALEPEELAGFVLELLNTQGENSSLLNPGNFGMVPTFAQYPREFHDQVGKCLMEAWAWLEREGLIAPRPGNHHGWVFVTRRGKSLKSAGDLKAYRQRTSSRAVLHPSIATKVWAPFLRGDYDTAIFQSFREVEIAIRAAGKYPPDSVGVDLARKAFHPETGPLRNPSRPAAERQAL